MKIVGGILGIILFLLIGPLIGGFFVMLIQGALWHEFDFWQPISYFQGVLIALALSLVGKFFKGSGS